MVNQRSLLWQSLTSRLGYRGLVLVVALFSAVAGLASPFFQKLFVDRLLQAESLAHGINGFAWTETTNPIWLVAVAFVFTLAAQASGVLSQFIAINEGLILQRDFSDRLYRKMLAIRSDQLGSTTVGEVVSIYATDVPGGTALIDQVLPMLASIVFPLLFAPLAIKWICGIPVSSTLFVMAGIILVTLVLSTRQSRFFYRFKQLAAERTGLVNEWVQNIRLLRILGWVENFESKIFKKREEETLNRVRMVTNGQLMNAFGSSINFVINVVGVGTLIFMRPEAVTPGELFALLWIFGVFLSRPFRQIPWAFTFTLDSLSSLKRVQGFLTRKSDPIEIKSEAELSVYEPKPYAIEIEALNLEIGGQKLLTDIDLSIRAGELVAVVGEVGSGKSLLVLSLAGETGATFKKFQFLAHDRNEDALSMSVDERRRHFAFVGQDGFVMSATLRENVAFRYEALGDTSKVVESLETAQFRIQGEHLTDGLETEIGERGVNLSGGQRQRVALARAHYLDRPVFLLDDCLSAVDVDTERLLIAKLIDGAWAGRTRLLITHRLSVLEKVDRILFMENGRIADQGTFEELIERSTAMREFVASVRRSDQAAEKKSDLVTAKGGLDGKNEIVH